MLRTLIVLLFLTVAAPAYSQASFLLGMTTGMVMTGPNSSQNSGGSNIMFLADEPTRQRVNPLDVRAVSVRFCFENRGGHSIREVIAASTAEMPREHRNSPTILRVMLHYGMERCSYYVVHYITP